MKTKIIIKKDDLRRVAEIAGDVLKVSFSAGVGSASRDLKGIKEKSSALGEFSHVAQLPF